MFRFVIIGTVHKEYECEDNGKLCARVYATSPHPSSHEALFKYIVKKEPRYSEKSVHWNPKENIAVCVWRDTEYTCTPIQ